MNLKSLGFSLLLLSGLAHADNNQVIGCFTSGKVNVKFVQVNQDGISLGYVKYSKSDKGIPLLFISDSSEVNEDGRPGEYTSKWAEFIDGKVNGYYTIMSQGARFYQLTYKSKKNTTTSFQDNTNAYNENGTDCKW
ncbi:MULTISPECIES: hypothetical protein [Erwiniaceae]|jgi:hypothetical protein|uniref:Uncharacterized protein n=1 Tax=Erwinia persicina TaxID=55211 RepID=A0A4U3EUX4_9GAMM|nr:MULTISPECIES: hypothetical protein [Erwiniaceae]MBD8105837.1 hypothetical protein [Erwinia persicina]MBD8142671.1 hypothetical protein [Pantoea agglomerans]MBD8209397.1 hypothetical protein [Erwinia persicina]MBD8224138.1 hypothetical protein [Pantoea agglomerans]TKJ84441.1 hypothetical protein EpCFBP13511_21270 [Erwinia persicina]